MLTAEARVEIARPSRYLVQLCRHADQMRRHLRHGPRAHDDGAKPPEVRHVEWSDTAGIVTSDRGRWTLRATANTLTLCVAAADEENLRRFQDLLACRLEKIGRRDHLTVIWQRPETVQDQPREAAGTIPVKQAETYRRHRRRRLHRKPGPPEA